MDRLFAKYTYTSLEAAFNGPFKAENKDKIWAPVPDSDVPSEKTWIGMCQMISLGNKFNYCYEVTKN